MASIFDLYCADVSDDGSHWDWHAALSTVETEIRLSTVHTYCRWVMWTAGWMVGLKTEFRGKPPTEEALVAAKHQSFLDVLMIASQIPQPKYIMKSSLKHVPVLGWFGKLTGSVPVERGKRAEAIKQMMDGVKSGKVPGGQLVIYPQEHALPQAIINPIRWAVRCYTRNWGSGAILWPAMLAYFGRAMVF